MPPKSKSVARHQASHKRTGVWWTPEEHELLIANAQYCGLNVSEYIRRCALDKKIVPRTDTETIKHLMKLGGLQVKLITDLRSNSDSNNPVVLKIISDTNALYRDIQNAIRSIGASK